jgi:transposase
LIQGCLLGEASLGYPSDVSDAAWKIIAPLLPSERGRWARPAQDNRKFFNGMMWIMRTGAPWRYLPSDYGKWNSVYVRFRRWAETGVWDAILETLVELGLTDDWAHMMDSTTVRAHAQAAGGKGGLIQMLLVEAAAVFRQRSTPGQTVKDVLLALSSQAAKPRIIAA